MKADKRGDIAIKVEEAVGKVLMHDVTSIRPGKFKGPMFKKGHVIKEEDVENLKDLGKYNVFVYDIPDDEYHEDEAGRLFAGFAGKNVEVSGPSEGKMLFTSLAGGMVLIDKKTVDGVNGIGGIAFTTVHSNIPVSPNDKVAGIRIIPLSLKKETVHKALDLASGPPVEVVPFSEKKVGLIVTGNEVASGRIKDAFRPVIEKKVAKYGSRICKFSIMGDDPHELKTEIKRMSRECGLIILTGGMSVDPDDTTKTAINEAGVETVAYGAPVLPGNMFMAGYLGEVPVFGVPACALYFDITVLDLFLPYAFAGVRIRKSDITGRGYGGYCRHCEVCIFPRCGFGKC
ncbi:MAG: molybdopterin-binding protein [Elusimicrobia bacterium]|nr:molybdopterin-binding protein [Elusimicrobiota bacterium]